MGEIDKQKRKEFILIFLASAIRRFWDIHPRERGVVSNYYIIIITNP